MTASVGGRDPSLAERLSAAVQTWRERLGWTQERLAARAGLSPTAISKLERGAAKVPSLFVALGLADAFGLSLDELLGRTLPPARPKGFEVATRRQGSSPRRSWTFLPDEVLPVPFGHPNNMELTIIGAGSFEQRLTGELAISFRQPVRIRLEYEDET